MLQASVATHLPAAAAVVFPADDSEGRFARGAEAAGLVRHPFRGVCCNESQGHVSPGMQVGWGWSGGLAGEQAPPAPLLTQ